MAVCVSVVSAAVLSLYVGIAEFSSGSVLSLIGSELNSAGRMRNAAACGLACVMRLFLGEHGKDQSVWWAWRVRNVKSEAQSRVFYRCWCSVCVLERLCGGGLHQKSTIFVKVMIFHPHFHSILRGVSSYRNGSKQPLLWLAWKIVRSHFSWLLMQAF